MGQWHWPRPSCGVPYYWVLPQNTLQHHPEPLQVSHLSLSDDLLSASMLEVVEEEQATSPKPAEETRQWGEELES